MTQVDSYLQKRYETTTPPSDEDGEGNISSLVGR